MNLEQMEEFDNKLANDTDTSLKIVYNKLSDNHVNDKDILFVLNILKNEIQKRTVAENEKFQRTAHLETSQNLACIGSWELDLSNPDEPSAIYLSDETYRIFGYVPGAIAITNEIFYQTVHVDDRTLVRQAMTHTIQTGEIYDIEHRIVTPAGIEKIVHERAEIVYEPITRTPLIIIGTTQDVTRSKQAKAALKKANYELKTLFDNMQECFFTIDVTINKLVQISPSCEEIYGYTVEEFIERHELWFSLILEEDLPMIHAKLSDLSKGESFVNTYRIRSKNGNIKWLETKMTPSLDPDKNVVRLDGFTADITARKGTEEALKSSNEELKKSNSELDKFVYSVSHDLRAPLSSMLGVVSIIESEITDEKVCNDVKLLKDGINKLDGFIIDILNYSRNSRLEVKPKEICFKELVDEIKKNLKYMASARNIVEIKTDISDHFPFYSDETRLSIILNNLISNAIRYSSPNITNAFVEVRITTFSTGAEIIINDNGIGVAKENHNRIFDMFYRVSKKSVGSGLGLYIVREAVEKLGGNIHLESRSGIGTRFTIFLPIVNKN